MNLYVYIALAVVVIGVACLYAFLEIKRIVVIHARITQEGSEEIVKRLIETNQLLKEIRDIEFVISDDQIKNSRYIPKKNWDHSFNEKPFESLRKTEENIKATSNQP